MTTYISKALRDEVTQRAGNCCEYCLLNQAAIFFKFEVDHIIAEKHRGKTESINLCLSCPDCNTYKGSDIASVDEETGELTFLFHPRQQLWSDHFELVNGIIEPLTATGRVTVALLRLNQSERVIDRQLYTAAGLYPCQKSS